MKSATSDALKRANQIRYIVPTALFFIVLFYETWEHILSTGLFKIDIHWTSEIFFFGLVGPTAVFGVLTYVIRLLDEQLTITAELETLNRTLEINVEERTEALAERNEELAQANEELKELDRLKSDFVSLVSHELRGPLTSLNGGLEIALQQPKKLPAQARKVLEVMSQETKRLTEFVQTILDVSRLDAGILNLNLGPVAVEPFLHHLINATFPNSEREVELNVPNSLSPIWVDEIYFEKVFSNLLTNADKYSPPDEPIMISISEENGSINISVTDRGQGIPKHLHNRIFKRFQRLENQDSPNTKGWGLGLYFAKEIMEAHGGKLTLISPVQQESQNPGASFTLCVQIAKEEPEYVQDLAD